MHRFSSARHVLVSMVSLLMLSQTVSCSRTHSVESGIVTESLVHRSVTSPTFVEFRGRRTPAMITFFANRERTDTTIGTLGFDIKIENFATLSDFHFEDFEGPDAAANGKKSLIATLHRRSGRPLSFEFSPAGYVSSDSRTENASFHFSVAYPSFESGSAKELLRALSHGAVLLDITIADTRDASATLRSSIAIRDKQTELGALVEGL